MAPDRKWMWIRLAVWVVILAYVVTMLREPELSDAVGQAALEASGLSVAGGRIPLIAPAGTAPQASQPGDAAGALESLQGALAACPAPGATVSVVLGPKGLERASAEGPVPSCLAGALWGAVWPALETPLELEISG